jgi:hypothetical protein
MTLKHLILIVAAFAASSASLTFGADDPKKAPAKKTEAKAKGDVDAYPFYGKVVAVTARTLTIVRSDSPEAAQVKFNVNASTEYVNGDKPATVADVKVGTWVGGLVKKAASEGNDTILKLNVGVKQKAAAKAPAKKKADTKKPDAKKTETKKKSE